MKKQIIDNGDHWLVNDRYAVYKDDGAIYDTLHAKDIPQIIFKWRDQLMASEKINQ